MIKYTLVHDVSSSSLRKGPCCFEYQAAVKNGDTPAQAFPSLPILVSGADGYELVLHGGTRHLLEREGGGIIAQALVIEDCTPGEIIRHLISLKAGMKDFNLVERARALKRLLDSGLEADMPVLRLLDIPPGGDMREKFLTLATAPEPIVHMAATGSLHPNTLFEMFRFEENLWIELARFIASLAMGTKKRNDLLSMTHEISKRDDRPVAALIRDAQTAVQYVTDPPQRAEGVYRFVYAARYPTAQEYRRRFLHQLKQTGIERDFHLRLPADFERWEFQLDFPFRSLQDFRKKVRRLREIGESEAFARLMEMRS